MQILIALCSNVLETMTVAVFGECSRNSSASDSGNNETACCYTSHQRQRRGARHIMYLSSVTMMEPLTLRRARVGLNTH